MLNLLVRSVTAQIKKKLDNTKTARGLLINKDRALLHGIRKIRNTFDVAM